MICYKDMTFCPYYKLCIEGALCKRALTECIIKEANKWWSGDENKKLDKYGNTAPICYFVEKPNCFKEF